MSGSIEPSETAATSPALAPLAVPGDLEATLVLCRHGESTWIVEGRFQGAADPPLSERGERQAALLAARLADPHQPPALPLPAGRPTAIWHSPLRRTAATAQAIASATSTPLRAEDGLREIGQGDWEGLLVADILATDGDRLRAWRRSPVGNEAPGGETLPDVEQRARAVLARILEELTEAARRLGQRDPDRPPVIGYGGAAQERTWGIVVGHDGLLRVAMLALLGLPIERFWTFPFVPAGITVIEFHRGQAIVRAHDLDAHLAALEEGDPDQPREGAL